MQDFEDAQLKHLAQAMDKLFNAMKPEVEEDYTEEDKYDWDRNDRSQRCKHGTFIGSAGGPDIMCFDCEME